MSEMVNIDEDVKKYSARLCSMEAALGKGLNDPFNSSNSGVRKIMNGSYQEQAINLLHPEVPIISSGYEQRFGEYSSSIIEAPADMTLVGDIQKFEGWTLDNETRQDYMIFRDDTHKTLRLIRRIFYHQSSEKYGYSYDNSTLDALHVGNSVRESEMLRRSTNYDEFGNRQDGVNLLTVELASHDTMEDCININETAVHKFDSLLYHPVEISVNPNDIFLNLYGDDDNYKVIPDIGEEIKDGILCALRRQNKDESLYMQSKRMLQKMISTDESYTVHGKVVDIDLLVNSPEVLESQANTQLKEYYEDQLRVCKELIECVNHQVEETGYSLDYDLDRTYTIFSKMLNGIRYADKSPSSSSYTLFNGFKILIHVIEVSTLKTGDKITNRYGGKGVVYIKKEEDMCRLVDGTPVEVEYNKFSVPNRENFGFLWEQEINFYSNQISSLITQWYMDLSMDQIIDIVYTFYHILSPEMADAFKDYIDGMKDDDVIDYIAEMLEDENIYIALKPLTEGMNIDKLIELRKAFPWVRQQKIYVPMKGSDNVVRYIKSRRSVVVSKTFLYRLKQISEEKFSATSLASVNLRGENTKNKASKYYKTPHSDTPVRMGNMEIQDLSHMNIYSSEIVIYMLLLYAASPDSRDKFASMLFGKIAPINIELDSESHSRAAEILNVYLKAIGLELDFHWEPRERKILFQKPLFFSLKPRKPFLYLGPNVSDERKAQIIKAMENRKHRLFAKPLFFKLGKKIEDNDIAKELLKRDIPKLEAYEAMQKQLERKQELENAKKGWTDTWDFLR